MTREQVIRYKLNMIFRIFYILAFNAYSWYWLYKIIWMNQSSWEDYANWFFVTCGVHFFVIDYSKFWSKNVKKLSDVFDPEIN